MNKKPVELIIAGCGGRGAGYAAFAKQLPDKAKVVGVADPREHYRNTMARDHSVPESNVFTTWEDMAAREKVADAVLICTQDAMHRDPALEFAAKGQLKGDSSKIVHFDFLTNAEKTIDTNASDNSILGGHGGGDGGLMTSFVSAVAGRDPSKIISGPDETLETHLAVFAAERSRKDGAVVSLVMASE